MSTKDGIQGARLVVSRAKEIAATAECRLGICMSPDDAASEKAGTVSLADEEAVKKVLVGSSSGWRQ
jgi:hypothetical protein